MCLNLNVWSRWDVHFTNIDLGKYTPKSEDRGQTEGRAVLGEVRGRRRSRPLKNGRAANFKGLKRAECRLGVPPVPARPPSASLCAQCAVPLGPDL